MTRPNIIVILADDMGYGDIGAFGNEWVLTPHLDTLAAQGVAMTQHYSASPMCAPARAGLLTGRYPHRTGAIDVVECRGLDRIALRERTWADLLKAEGYATGLFGKWHNGAVDPRYHPNQRGFDEFAGFRAGFCDYYDWMLDYNGAFREADGRYLTDVFTEEAVAFIERHQREPFALAVTYNSPHTPLQVPEEETEPFRHAGRFTDAVGLIYGMNRRMDRGVGRILDALDRCGLADNTFLLFTSDNGPMFTGRGERDTTRFNGHFNGSKGDVLEGGIRVPALVRWPAGLDVGQRCEGFAHFTDWLPTLLDVAGVPAAADLALDGRSLLPLMRDEVDLVNPRRFWQWNRYDPVPRCNAAMRDGPWKLCYPTIPEAVHKPKRDSELTAALVRHPDQVTDICREPVERTLSEPKPPRLFNLEQDPYEQHDLAGLQPRRVHRMKQELEAWFAEVNRERESITD